MSGLLKREFSMALSGAVPPSLAQPPVAMTKYYLLF
jgi:hypothetical protein